MNKETLLKKYLHSELTDQEYKTFMTLVDSDPDYAEEVSIESVLYAKHKVTLKESIFNIDHTIEGTNSTKTIDVNHAQEKRMTIFLILRNVAAIFILGIFSYFCFNQFSANTISQDNLVDTYLSDIHVPPSSFRNSVTNESDQWYLTSKAYSQKDYDTSIEILTEIKNKNNEQLLYLGLSKLYSQNWNSDDALIHFDEILSGTKRAHKDEANWYKSLILLKKDNLSDAKDILTTIISEKSWNHQTASKIISTLE